MKPYETSLDPNTIIAGSLSQNDYVDVFSIRINRQTPLPVEQMPLFFFQSMPKWFGVLMMIRETIAGWIGLKTAKGMDVMNQLKNFKGEPGESIALFHVLGRTTDELMMGETDKHLDFRLSFISRKVNDNNELTLATTVQFNGWLGRLYFLPVKPVHRLIVPILLRRIAQKVQTATPSFQTKN